MTRDHWGRGGRLRWSPLPSSPGSSATWTAAATSAPPPARAHGSTPVVMGQPPSSSGPSRPKAVARGRDRHDGEQGRRPRRSRPPPVHSSPLISRKGAANTGSFGPAANSSSAGLTAGKAGYAQDHGQGRRARGPHNGGRGARVRPSRGHRWERPRANPGRGYGPRHAPRPRRGSGDHRIGAPREPQGYCKPASGAGIGADGDRGAVFAAEPASGEEIGPRETLATVLRGDSAGGEWRSGPGSQWFRAGSSPT